MLADNEWVLLLGVRRPHRAEAIRGGGASDYRRDCGRQVQHLREGRLYRAHPLELPREKPAPFFVDGVLALAFLLQMVSKKMVSNARIARIPDPAFPEKNGRIIVAVLANAANGRTVLKEC